MDRALIARLLEPTSVVVIAAVVGALAIAGAYFYSGIKPAGSYVTPKLGSVSQTVEASGAVKAAESVDLSFELSGRIAYAGPSVGAHVGAGTTLATLSSADLSASLSQTKAALAVQEAKLASLEAGNRPEDIAVAQAAVTGAQAALLQAKQSALTYAQDAYIKSDDAIHNKVDQFMAAPRTMNPAILPTLNDSQTANDINAGRLSMEILLSNWQTYLNGLPPDVSSLDIASVSALTRTNLSQVSSYLDTVAKGLTEAIPTTSYSASTIQGYETNIATARSNVSTDLTSFNTSVTAEKAAESALASAQSQLTLTQAPATVNDIQAQQAQVAVAQASVDAAAAQLAKAAIVAPISGTITRNDAHAGATAAPGVALMTLNSDSAFQIEIYVSEADVANVHAEQTAQVTLDAYGDTTKFAAHVLTVDPAATVQNGVPSYKVTLAFDKNDPRIQTGMTGNVTIATASKESALLVPSTAIIRKGNDTFVLRKTSGGDVLSRVQTGLVGGGFTEIVSGLSQNDSVRSFGAQ